ncbi:DNA-3-methyladenine glycosylase family protein [Actinophytocola algeriensis]|uniref:DNA-3-methyladenine glycosylase II n=1 Tax=Actinophytocola algeriensis TaxID=1768010 RepID=A0A7W7VJD9_9PSEU|nr:DNA-3-methyladenine glycosylase 2 family protein [Actinophytocola algeriensis]MBB4912418.1 DNA-3-methyladenine glycosylase II [Actinophytocola algeriensis]MBE1481009.1 DNA-3-methyladenine glycosylase II [Actinophytocola algeriensis]
MTTIDQVTWLDVPVQGPFDLTASARFLEGFAPAARADAAASPGELRLAFPVAPSWRPVGVLVKQAGPNGPVRMAVHGDPSDVDNAAAAARRILSLDVDGTGFAAVGARDPVVGDLQARYPGLRPVAFHSPYEAACFAIIGHRIRMNQAATIKRNLARELGSSVDVHGVVLPSFPPPAVLRAVPMVPMVSEVKSDRLKAIAEAAEAGRLDAAELRSIPVAEALTRLRTLPGIGEFSSELVLLRGAAHPDGFPDAETRLHEEMRRVYPVATKAELSEVADGWRPFRTWVSVLFRVRREELVGN